MKKIIVIVLLTLTLTSCALLRIRKNDVEQGNFITPQMIGQLHPGMSERSVEEIMGPPMLINTFTPNRVDYVYTYKPGYGPFQEKYVTLMFRNGILKDIRGRY